MKIPDSEELLIFFEGEPVESIPEDGFYCYRFEDNSELELYFSFSKYEGSVQVRLVNRGVEVALVSEELATSLEIRKDKSGEYIYADFDLGNACSRLEVRLKPNINFYWYTLQSM